MKLLTCSAIVLIFSISSSQAAYRYHMTLLPTGPQVSTTSAISISEDGRIAGEAQPPSGQGSDPMSVYWPSVTSPIEIVQPSAFNQTGGVNSAGTVVGIASEGFAAYRWSSGATFTLLPGSTGGTAQALSDQGQIVGSAAFPGTTGMRAASWIDNVPTNLGALPGDTFSIARAINNVGDIVGSSDGSAVLWSNGQITELGTLGANHEALGVNNKLEIVGRYISPPGQPFAVRPFVWRDGVMSDLGSLGFSSAEALAINDDSLIVGRSSAWDGGLGAVLWRDGHTLRLSDHVIDLPSQAFLQSANDINQSGTIVGSGTFGGQTRAYMLEPVPATDVVVDGTVDIDDLLAVIEAWGECPAGELCAADVDHSGVVNVDDLLAVIQAWD